MKDPQPRTPQAPSKPSTVTQTHLVVRSRKGTFRRCGLKFSPDYQVYLLTDLGAKLEQIEAEPMLDARRITSVEAEHFAVGAMPEDDESTTKAELRQFAEQWKVRAERAEKQLDELRAKFSGVDLPPKNVDDLTGGLHRQ